MKIFSRTLAGKTLYGRDGGHTTSCGVTVESESPEFVIIWTSDSKIQLHYTQVKEIVGWMGQASLRAEVTKTYLDKMAKEGVPEVLELVDEENPAL